MWARKLGASKKAATATVQETSEPQGGLGAVESLEGRGRMAAIVRARPCARNSHLYLKQKVKTQRVLRATQVQRDIDARVSEDLTRNASKISGLSDLEHHAHQVRER